MVESALRIAARTALSLMLLAGCTAGDERGAAQADGAPALLAILQGELDASARAELQQRLSWPAECDGAFAATDVSGGAGLLFHAAADGGGLLTVRCAAGAYQPSHVLVRLDIANDTGTVLEFPTYVSADGTTLQAERAIELWGEILVTDDASGLIVLNVMRQTHDCGTWTRYDVAGDAVRVVAVHARLPCPPEPSEPVALAATPPPAWPAVETD